MATLSDLTAYGKLAESNKYEYVTIHSLGDDKDILKKLNLSENECDYCGAYWLYENILYLLMFYGGNAKSNVTAFTQDEMIHFTIFTNKSPLYYIDIENTLDFLSNWIQKNTEYIKSYIENPNNDTPPSIIGNPKDFLTTL